MSVRYEKVCWWRNAHRQRLSTRTVDGVAVSVDDDGLWRRRVDRQEAATWPAVDSRLPSSPGPTQQRPGGPGALGRVAADARQRRRRRRGRRRREDRRRRRCADRGCCTGDHDRDAHLTRRPCLITWRWRFRSRRLRSPCRRGGAAADGRGEHSNGRATERASGETQSVDLNSPTDWPTRRDNHATGSDPAATARWMTSEQERTRDRPAPDPISYCQRKHRHTAHTSLPRRQIKQQGARRLNSDYDISLKRYPEIHWLTRNTCGLYRCIGSFLSLAAKCQKSPEDLFPGPVIVCLMQSVIIRRSFSDRVASTCH